jgi:hypothetical protein
VFRSVFWGFFFRGIDEGEVLSGADFVLSLEAIDLSLNITLHVVDFEVVKVALISRCCSCSVCKYGGFRDKKKNVRYERERHHVRVF